MRRFTRYVAIGTILIVLLQSRLWAFNQDQVPERMDNQYPSLISNRRGTPPEDNLLAIFLQNHEIHSLKEYVAWFEKNMTYQPDGKIDQWSKPIKTLIKKSGDCEDLAFLNAAVLHHFGYKARVLGTQKESKHHVFCIFKKDARIYIFDNTRLIKTKASSLDQIVAFLYNKYKIDYLLEVRLDPKSISVLFTKQMIQNVVKTVRPFPSS